MKKIINLVLLAAAALISQQTLAQPASRKLALLFDAYYKGYLETHALNATFAGDHRFDDRLPNDISTPYLAAAAKTDRKYLKRLAAFKSEALNPADRISLGVLKEMLEMDLASTSLHLEYLPINQFASVPLLFGQLGSGQSAQPFAVISDYHKWIKRIGDFNCWMDTAMANMRKGASSGVVLPKVLVARVIIQMESMGKDDSANVFYGPLNHLPSNFSEQEKLATAKALMQALTGQLFPKYRQFARFLKEDYMPYATDSVGLSGIRGGLQMYHYFVRLNTTVDKSPEAIFLTGISEVARLRGKMELIKRQTGFTGSLAEFFNYLKTELKFRPFHSAEEVLRAYADVYGKVKPRLSSLFSMVPKSRFEIRRVEAFREAGQNGPSYSIGSLDGRRPGVFYVPVPDPSKINVVSLGLEATFLHEAIPGHHFQISLQQENIRLPQFRRQISFTAFTEGWGLYAESLGKELGCYRDPYQEMGALNNEMLRAIRLVTDVGLHTGKMTMNQCIDYIVSNQSVTREEALSAVLRYMAMPGQALSYKMGELEIQRLKQNCSKMLGKKFSIIKFHQALLNQGDMPLNVLSEYITKWAKEQRNHN